MEISHQEDQVFHRAIGRVLWISQIFALLPVSNVNSRNVEDIRYSWLSPRVIFAIVVFLLNCTEMIIAIYSVFREGINFRNSGNISFLGVCILEHYYFWRLAIKWPAIMRAWRQMESNFLQAPYRIYASYNMKTRMQFFSFFIMFGAISEHCLLMSNSVVVAIEQHRRCHWGITLMETVYRRERFHLYSVLPYRWWLLPILEFINLTLAYPRSFTDAFIICISIGLVARLRQLHMRVEALHTKAMPPIFWTEIREHYLAVKKLMRLVNGEICELILLASGNNMYFICVQLFNSFQNIGVDLLAALVFWYSLAFAIVRSVMTLYIAGTVNDYTQRILLSLRDVPSKSWCPEIERFADQLAVDITALSGNGFFFMTRKLILAMASTIVTYELLVMDVISEGLVNEFGDFCKNF